MDNVILYKNKSIISSYDIIGNKIVFTSGEQEYKLKLTQENLELVYELSTIKYEKIYELKNIFKKELINNSVWAEVYFHIALINSITLIRSENIYQKVVSGIIIPYFLTFFIVYLRKIKNLKEKNNYIKKFIFYIENEDYLNYEIIKNYLVISKSDKNINLDEIPFITLDDLDFYDIKELEEIVELTKENNDPDVMKLNLSMFNKLKGTN